MKAIEIVNKLKGLAGRHVLAIWTRKCKTLRSCKFTITKRTACFVRTGINYANLAEVKSAIEQGVRDAVGKLPFGQWREGFVNYIIDHKGVEYVRLYPASFDNLKTPKVEYVMDGIPATYEDVEPYLMASEKRNRHEHPACFTVKAENIIEIAEANQ